MPYVITTVLGVLVFIGLGFAPVLMEYFAAAFAEDTLDILVVDYTGEFLPVLAEVAADSGAEAVRIEAVPVGEESTAFQRVIDEGRDGLLLVDLPEFAFTTLDAANYA